jgi:hypothetical protein
MSFTAHPYHAGGGDITPDSTSILITSDPDFVFVIKP